VLEACVKRTGLTPGKARALLGTFLFSGEEVEKPLDGISGGERQRLTLAILVSSGANVLILDEPTNHLDIDAREALEDALHAYEGALLLVSHDRALLDAVGSRTVAVEDGTLRTYVGGWPEYVRVREERKAKPAKKPAPKPEPVKARAKDKPKAKANGNGNGNGASKNARRRLRELEREVEQAESVLAQLEVELAAPDAWATPEASAEATERHREAKRAVEEAYSRWEAASA
jgi:ATP-binding cassette subfamily F protein 3